MQSYNRFVLAHAGLFNAISQLSMHSPEYLAEQLDKLKDSIRAALAPPQHPLEGPQHAAGLPARSPGKGGSARLIASPAGKLAPPPPPPLPPPALKGRPGAPPPPPPPPPGGKGGAAPLPPPPPPPPHSRSALFSVAPTSVLDVRAVLAFLSTRFADSHVA